MNQWHDSFICEGGKLFSTEEKNWISRFSSFPLSVVTYEWVMSLIHTTYTWVIPRICMRHMNESHHGVMPHTHESCHIYMSHVTHDRLSYFCAKLFVVCDATHVHECPKISVVCDVTHVHECPKISVISHVTHVHECAKISVVCDVTHVHESRHIRQSKDLTWITYTWVMPLTGESKLQIFGSPDLSSFPPSVATYEWVTSRIHATRTCVLSHIHESRHIRQTTIQIFGMHRLYHMV